MFEALKSNNRTIHKRKEYYTDKSKTTNLFPTLIPKTIFILLGLLSLTATGIAQSYNRSTNQNNFVRRKAFRREIARLEITVEREGKLPLPMTMVPRVEKDDVIRIRMLDEPINGIRPDESFWDWTLVVAFVNPSRNEKNEESVSREINFKRDGWYKEHLFTAPYDSQPVFFLYPRPKYRKKIRKLIQKNFTQIKKIGEMTLEIAGAYAHIGTFLNELQQVINRDQYRGYNNYNFGRTRQNGDVFFRNEMVERLAQSFNIQLPSCWGKRMNFNNNSNNFISRAQCVAKNVRLEDFDVSIGKMIQQGGLFAATRLIEKYPQLAYWINVAALAIDFILKITKRSPLRIVPTMALVRNNRRNNSRNSRGAQSAGRLPPSQKISLYAENPPTDMEYVTAFPVVLHKWQAEPDPEVISLPIPSLMEPCLHVGQNILKNTDVTYDWLRDPFARDFRLVMSAENGFTKEFYLTKNLGMSGWQLILNRQDIRAFPQVAMVIGSKISAARGFSRIESETFAMPIAGGGKWKVSSKSLSDFSVGGKRRVVIKNTMGSRCLQSVKYRPSSGGEFIFTADARTSPLMFSEDGKEAWFEIDTTNFGPGQGKLELRTYGNNQPKNLGIRLYPRPPVITKLKIHKGDNRLTIEGNQLEQIKILIVSGKTARPSTLQNRPRGRQPSILKTFVFNNQRDVVLTETVSIEMRLDGGRLYTYPESFPVLPARPAIEANAKREIEGMVVANSDPKEGTSRFDLSKYPVVPVDTKKMTVTGKTTLTDYGFKAENIEIETRIENGQVGRNALPQAAFEVLDSFNIRIEFTFNEQYQQFLAGRRLQFRIKDRMRADSDWYTIKQTFVRTPRIDSVICEKQQCKITGKGLDYIGQLSTDGGKVWQSRLQIQPIQDGKAMLTISGVKVKKQLRIKLRDFPKTEGLEIK